jgi:hypothetical protein
LIFNKNLDGRGDPVTRPQFAPWHVRAGGKAVRGRIEVASFGDSDEPNCCGKAFTFREENNKIQWLARAMSALRL